MFVFTKEEPEWINDRSRPGREDAIAVHPDRALPIGVDPLQIPRVGRDHVFLVFHGIEVVHTIDVELYLLEKRTVKKHGIYTQREDVVMLTDTNLRNLKPGDTLYKLSGDDVYARSRSPSIATGRSAVLCIDIVAMCRA